MNNTLNARMNAEGLTFAAIEAAARKAGESMKTKGFTYGPFKVGLRDLPRYNALYRGMVMDAAPTTKTWEEITSPFPEHAWVEAYQAHMKEKWGAVENGTELLVKNEYTTWWIRKIDDDNIVIKKIHDTRQELSENTVWIFLPDGIRAATAALIGADLSSSTFHMAFDAIVDGTAVY